ncbi:Mur ligase [Ceratobasidium sp. AG-I]|nr:Mur ligase [Ceratobasidium sp. AG-I]
MSGINLGLERVSHLMRLLPKYTRPTVHVAGTNGKGSVTTLIEFVLREAGFSTGRFNSPHLVNVWDSISLNARAVPESRYTSTREMVQKLNNEHEIGASSFELHAVSALSLFQETGVDVVVLEVGMGGLTDATNVVPDEAIAVSAITNVDYDHQGFLGDTIQEIASHKAGIVRPHGICVMGPQTWPEAKKTIRERAKLINAHIIPAPVATSRQWDDAQDGAPPPKPRLGFVPPPVQPCSILLPVRGSIFPALISLHGRHQLENVSTAASALDVLRSHPTCTSKFPIFSRITDQHIKDGLRQAQWPGRLSWHTLPSQDGANSDQDLNILVDGAHNAASAQALAAYVDSLDSSSRPVFIIGLSHSPAKPPTTTLAPLIRPGDRVIATNFSPVQDMPWVRPVEPNEISACAEQLVGPHGGAHVAPNLHAALAQAKELLDNGNNEYVVLAGSLYLVADFYRNLDS